MTATILQGDCRTVLATLSAGSVQCCITSPPYFNLRSYLPADDPAKSSELGCEQTPEEYIINLVEVFREVRRVLRDDGTCWIVIGDSYATTVSGQAQSYFNGQGWQGERGGQASARRTEGERRLRVLTGTKPKDLIGIPWMVAFALRADGWYLRDAIVWHKPAPMPGSQRDRCTSSYEFVFLLAKRNKYFFDIDAIAEPCGEAAGRRQTMRAIDLAKERGFTDDHLAALRATGVSSRGESRALLQRRGETGRKTQDLADAAAVRLGSYAREFAQRGTRSPRNVWTLHGAGYSGAHHAVFPEALAERCVRAGSSERGACPDCGAPHARVVERERTGAHAVRGKQRDLSVVSPQIRHGKDSPNAVVFPNSIRLAPIGGVASRTTGWSPTCSCPGDKPPVPCVTLDPFAGAGTVSLVSERLGRDSIAIELNPTYIDLIRARLSAPPPKPARRPKQPQKPAPATEPLPLFAALDPLDIAAE